MLHWKDVFCLQPAAEENECKASTFVESSLNDLYSRWSRIWILTSYLVTQTSSHWASQAELPCTAVLFHTECKVCLHESSVLTHLQHWVSSEILHHFNSMNFTNIYKLPVIKWNLIKLNCLLHVMIKFTTVANMKITFQNFLFSKQQDLLETRARQWISALDYFVSFNPVLFSFVELQDKVVHNRGGFSWLCKRTSLPVCLILYFTYFSTINKHLLSTRPICATKSSCM